jgi:two-component system sensor histidine kinase/response regulator
MKDKSAAVGARPGSSMSHAVREEVLLSLVRNSMDAIVSADGVIDYWNPAAEKLYGYTAAEAMGQPATLIVPADKLEEYEEMRRKLEHGERVDQFPTQRLKKDGTLVDVDITVFPVMDEAGKLAATSVISHDLTEQLRLRKEVEETAKVKADFLATMSHEIRTPLSAIVGTAELQMLSEMTGEQRRHMGVIQSSGELLLTIVDDILDFSKLTAGKLLIEKIEFNLAELAEGIIDTFGALVRSRKLELALFLDPGLPTRLRGDPKRVRQVLNNLLSNAIKFTPMGEVSLSTTKVEESADELVVCFEVKDQGIGIAPEVQSRLFQPFVQGEQSTSRRFGGTGLGLAISARLAEQMGGTIDLDSELGKGSTFRFHVRFEKVAEIAQPADMVAAVFTGIGVLIVSDGEIGRAAIARQLTSWGMTTRSISTESALSELRSASAQNGNYALVLLDEGRANQGLNLARSIKTDSLLENTKVIVMRSEPSLSSSTDTVDGWLAKPVSPALLFNSLQRLFSKNDLSNGNFARSVKAANPQIVWRKDIRVLVVEDNLTNQILIKEQLAVLGYTIHIVGDARGALAAISQSRYDVILMDCELPGMNGYDATAEIRRREGKNGRLKIIALTAHVSDNQKKRCLDAGMDGYLSKPARLQTLADSLDACASPEVMIAAHNMPSAPSGKPEEELDPGALAAIEELSKATGRNVFRDLVDTFLSDLPPRVKLLTTALESGNMSQLVSVAHPLKSSSAIVGAKKFSEICAAVERYARDGQLDQVGLHTRELLEAAKMLPKTLFGASSYK